MTTVDTPVMRPDYSLGRTPQEYERLRAQARAWEASTSRLLDHIRLAPGARCLDAGCGPGEAMRLMAYRVGPAGRVVGMDVDTGLGRTTEAALHHEGHLQCTFRSHDLTLDQPVPEGPYDLVLARLLLFHLPARREVLGRLWQAVAPGGHLVIQEYDLRAASVRPELASVAEVAALVSEAFIAAGCDIALGASLPQLFEDAGIGAPDGTDVAGRLEPLTAGSRMLADVFSSLRPLALARGITTNERAAVLLDALRRDADRFSTRPMLWPLMIGAWKRKTAS